MKIREFTKQAQSFVMGYPMIIILLALYWMMAVVSVQEKSVTFDEVVHITAGYLYWISGKLFHIQNWGVVTQRWATLPLLAIDLRFPSYENMPWLLKVWEIGFDFFHNMDNDLEFILLSSRAMTAFMGVLLGLLVYYLTYKLFHKTAAMIALFIYTFSPTMLAHGRLAVYGGCGVYCIAFVLSISY